MTLAILNFHFENTADSKVVTNYSIGLTVQFVIIVFGINDYVFRLVNLE